MAKNKGLKGSNSLDKISGQTQTKAQLEPDMDPYQELVPDSYQGPSPEPYTNFCVNRIRNTARQSPNISQSFRMTDF